MNEVMICLVGEQPIPNLLPIRYDQPAEVVLAYTESIKKIKEAYSRLERVLRGGPRVHSLFIHPYNILEAAKILKEFVNGRGWKPDQIVFNITGGTKLMSVAAYSLAAEWRCRFLYLESEETKSHVFRYRFNRDGTVALERNEVIPGVINLNDYLKVYLGDYQQNQQHDGFEVAVSEVLKPRVDQLLANVSHHGGAVEIDLVLRCANQVAIAEVKDTRKPKYIHKGIGQLNLAGSKQYFGTYTKKLLILENQFPRSESNWEEFAKESEIKIIELPSYGETESLSEQDKERLVREVREALGY